jgi:FlaA1/EpsC-like NDP-sugar epimerase
MTCIDGKRVLITGGTGSLGKVLLRRLLSGSDGVPEQIVVFSRDEAKQHDLRISYEHKRSATDEIIYDNFTRMLKFQIGDVRDERAVVRALRGMDIVFNAAALKQVPTCEYFPFEAVQTNINGAENIVSAINSGLASVETVVGISTDKAVKPVNVMGMTKSIQERIFARANLDTDSTRYVLARYGNVLASRGSVIPLFHDQINNGGPVTITHPDMTRFLLSLDEAVDLILKAAETANRGETYIPRVPSANIVDLAQALIGDRSIEIVETAVRPGEKLHEALISEEEAHRTMERDGNYVIGPILPELRDASLTTCGLTGEYSSEDEVMSGEQLRELLKRRRLMVEDELQLDGELLA